MYEQLKSYIAEIGKNGLCVAFSGGVDSSLLLKAASQLNIKTVAVTFFTRLHPPADIQLAQKLAAGFGVPLHIIEIDEFADKRIAENPVNRCYLCKRLLFSSLIKFAEENKLGCIIDGTNADDLTQYRPGLQALRELNIKSPLAELNISKQQVRALAAQLGIEVANRPSAPCLATRLPYNTKLDFGLLEKISAGEDYLKALGFATVRLRLHNDIVRIEVPKADFAAFIGYADIIAQRLKQMGFVYITLDIEGFRSGSMDIYINKPN
ncbi:MAG TPA: ATP-dependent sacrificial sulfur transferase LarE [Ruminococcaceae bacterium]|nr:ATP-dependent sacrificial sulfur transferase LarE [Oscillospiraceae bacterium]